ncbi:proteasome activator complex subunit 1 [Ambystoma mexicanum]|uniref:proteasome activator complex subunit 1 n=1 Tax=Ambystoma mexicanum TaxID=8296 RepID=UPI0037E7A4A0
MTSLMVKPEAKATVDAFKKDLNAQAQTLVGSHFPKKMTELDRLLKESELNLSDFKTLRAELDIPIPDPVKEKEKEEKRKKEKEAKGEESGKKKDDEEDKGPPCGPISSNEKIHTLLSRVKPEIREVKEKLNLVCIWVQLQIPKIEDGNNFGVAVQEKVFELMTGIRTKLEGFQTQISKYFLDRGDAVAKAAKQPHVGDYRQLVHELDEAQYAEVRVMVMEIRNTYAILYDIVMKNSDKIIKPRGESKALIY